MCASKTSVRKEESRKAYFRLALGAQSTINLWKLVIYGSSTFCRAEAKDDASTVCRFVFGVGVCL
ncbi:hypothetical protein LINPERPRIM_LOCUS19510, partial [Linum perenne]